MLVINPLNWPLTIINHVHWVGWWCSLSSRTGSYHPNLSSFGAHTMNLWIWWHPPVIMDPLCYCGSSSPPSMQTIYAWDFWPLRWYITEVYSGLLETLVPCIPIEFLIQYASKPSSNNKWYSLRMITKNHQPNPKLDSQLRMINESFVVLICPHYSTQSRRFSSPPWSPTCSSLVLIHRTILSFDSYFHGFPDGFPNGNLKEMMVNGEHRWCLMMSDAFRIYSWWLRMVKNLSLMTVDDHETVEKNEDNSPQ